MAIAFYFVHWLTDLAGAKANPLAGAEKLVLGLPLRALKAFVHAIPIVQRIGETSETELYESYLAEAWPAPLGPKPTGRTAIASMRLALQAQAEPVQRGVLAALPAMQQHQRDILIRELQRTGVLGQVYSSGMDEECTAGPAILLYYGPAFLQQCGASEPRLALAILSEVYRAARGLFPIARREDAINSCVTVRIDQLKGCSAEELLGMAADERWVLVRVSSVSAALEKRRLGRELTEEQALMPSIVLEHPTFLLHPHTSVH